MVQAGWGILRQLKILGLGLLMLLYCSGMLEAISLAETLDPEKIRTYDLGEVTLCPGQMRDIKPSSKYTPNGLPDPKTISGTMDAKVTSSKPDVGSAQYRQAARVIQVNAGANDGDTDLITDIIIDLDGEIDNSGNANSSPEDQPTPPDPYKQRFIVHLRVRPKKRCVAPTDKPMTTPKPPKEAEKEAQPVTETFVGYHIKLCVNDAITITPDREAHFSPSDKDAQRVKDLKLTNTDPAVAGNTFNNAKGGAARLTITGKVPGTTEIHATQDPPPKEGQGYDQIFYVEVIACEEETPETAPPPKTDTPPKKAEPETPKTTPQPPEKGKKDGKQSMLPGHMKTVIGQGLAVSTLPTDGGQLAVNCPEDTQDGDDITCSVITDDPHLNGVLDHYKIGVETTAFISDDTAVNLETAKTITDHHVSFKVPATAAALGGLTLVLINENGNPVTECGLPVHPVTDGFVPSETLDIPHTTEVGKPIEFRGRFTNPGVADDAVTVDGQPAQILAKSPRSLVSENPATTPGPHTVAVRADGQKAQATVENQPPSDGPASVNCDEAMSAYKSDLFAKTSQGWRPPRPPSHGTWVTVLHYQVLPNGAIQNVTVSQSSGYDPLDQSAMARVQQLRRSFGPLPACYTKSVLEIDHTFKVHYN